MAHNTIHLHSIVVHSVIALVLVAAGAAALSVTSTELGRFGPDLWLFLLRGSLVGGLLLSLPAIATGISDRNHLYATWHPSHRAKLWLSVVLVISVGIGVAASAAAPMRIVSWLGAAIGTSVVTVLALAAYGLRITLGRQALARTSYVSDMDRQPPVDILEAVAAAAADQPKLVDPHEEDAA